jgi:uncharacterized membrane protein
MPSENPTPARLEAFSDGVIAVIITIMVLEFKSPHDPRPIAFFAAFLPTLAVYALSFTFTGIYWVNHHHLVDRLHRIDAAILWSNLFFLFCLSLLPFCTGYALEQHFNSFSVAVYAAELLLAGTGFLTLSHAITRHQHRHGQTPTDLEASIQQAEWRKGLLSLTLYACAIPLAFWHPAAAAAIILLTTAIWILPGFLIPAAHQNCSTTGAI